MTDPKKYNAKNNQFITILADVKIFGGKAFEAG